MKKIGFLILHYHTIKDTIECVQSIEKNIHNTCFEIIIVDNNSLNGTGQELKKKYENKENIHVLLNKENIGFAKGNNIGFRYAKYELNCDFIVMMNNDTIILQENFLDIVLKEYQTSKFAVMGPKILLPEDKIYYYPEKLITKEELKKNIIKSYMQLILEYVYIAEIIRTLKKSVKKMIHYKPKKTYLKEEIENKTKNRKEDIVLHGCFLIFSPEYISRFDGLDDRTFLYKEEQLLYLRIKKNKLKTVYNPELVIFHNESSSTKTTTKKVRKKHILIYKNQIKSSVIVLEEIMQGEEK